ncbi:hypothetical protein WJX84_001348, partial [Apatococcus fuscideae]
MIDFPAVSHPLLMSQEGATLGEDPHAQGKEARPLGGIPAPEGNWASLPTFKFHTPAMYGMMGPAGGDPIPNPRASWLAGQALHGDVLLAMPRMRPSEWGTPVVPWSSLPIDTFWRWLASLLPVGQYQAARGAPLLAQLPASFRHGKAWYGPFPMDLLTACCRGLSQTGKPPAISISKLAHRVPEEEKAGNTGGADPLMDMLRAAAAAAALPPTPQNSPARPEPNDATAADGADGLAAIGLEEFMPPAHQYVATVMFPPVIPGIPCRLESDATEDPTAAEQSAALALLQALQSWLCTAFLSGRPPVQEPSGQISRVIIKDKGNTEAEAPRKDCLVIVHMRAWTADIPAGTLDDNGNPIDGFLLDDAGHFRFQWGASAMREGITRLIDLMGPGGKAEATMTLPINSGNPFMRGWDAECTVAVEYLGYRFVGASAGEVPILFTPPLAVQRHEHLPGLKKLVAVDISWDELRLVSKLAVQGLTPDEEAQPAEQVQVPNVELMLGNIACTAAETQAPHPHHHHAQRDYNAILHALGPTLLPNGRRNSDHRFEWTRREFQLWSIDLAERCGYAVRFEGIGTALDEGEVLKQAKKAAEVGDIGCASQAAIFTLVPGAPIRIGDPDEEEPSMPIA